MSRSTLRALVLLTGLMALLESPDVGAQVWSADVSAGRIVYDPALSNVGTANVVGSLKYDALRGAWVYGAAAIPFTNRDLFWGALGTGGRFVPAHSEARRATLGVDLSAHGFFFRDALLDQSGNGGALEAIPFTSLKAGSNIVELRGGIRAQALAYTGITQKRAVLETGAIVKHDARDVRLQGDVRLVRATEGTFPYVGASLLYGGSPVTLWALAGKWMSDDLNDVSLGAGANLALGALSSVWTSVRQEAPDPLYWNSPRRTWSVGLTHRFGRSPAPLLPTPHAQTGDVVIRVAVSESRDGDLSIAGSFNNWKPEPMKREGREWVIRLPLTAGVYQYAFRSGSGEWFVPRSIGGRRDDGMGGYVAVLVVS